MKNMAATIMDLCYSDLKAIIASTREARRVGK
jgi:hypothetical protein